jgi:ssDNA-binding Zn-finger/Zn-ribbon topoisomerase 1
MEVRRNRLNDSEFMGCTGFPECRHTEGIPEHLRLRALGAIPMPGFE